MLFLFMLLFYVCQCRKNIRIFQSKKRNAVLSTFPLSFNYCRRPESNRYGRLVPQDFKSCASASSATPAYGWRRIRTFESVANRFTVCPLWPLGNPSIYFYVLTTQTIISQNPKRSTLFQIFFNYFRFFITIAEYG